MALATNTKMIMLASRTVQTGAMNDPKNQPLLEIQQLHKEERNVQFLSHS